MRFLHYCNVFLIIYIYTTGRFRQHAHYYQPLTFLCLRLFSGSVCSGVGEISIVVVEVGLEDGPEPEPIETVDCTDKEGEDDC